MQPVPETSQYLTFNLTSEIQAMISMQRLNEILNLDLSQVRPIFEMTEPIMGAYGHRNDVLWIVDLPCLLGLMPLYRQNTRHTFSVMVLHQGEKVAGFAVPAVGHLLSCQAAQVRTTPLPQNPRNLNFCLKGFYRMPEGQDTLLLMAEKWFDLLNPSSAVTYE